jgi:chaperonin GroES
MARKDQEATRKPTPKVTMYGDLLLIDRDMAADMSPGGIALPDTSQTKPARGLVLKAGPGRVSEQGVLVPITTEEGQYIHYNKFAGIDVKINHINYVVIHETDKLFTED